MRTPLISATALGALVAAAGLAGAAAAQTTMGELTVIGRSGADSLSEAVGFSDLDLRNPADVNTLNLRVRDTATSLCHRLGEGNASTPITPGCVDDAVRHASEDVKTAVAMAMNAPPVAVLPPAQPYVAAARAPADDATDATASATTAGEDTSASVPAATYETRMVTNGPVPDTPENRARFGEPMSHAGKRTAASGN